MTYDKAVQILPGYPRVIATPRAGVDWKAFSGELIGVRRCDCCDNMVAIIRCEGEEAESSVGLRFVEPIQTGVRR